jgi:tRNA threonylcarbamoyladenosine biosynthesis protein TsaE
MQRISNSAEETRRFGITLGERLGPGDVVTLSGELGAGKTVLAQGIAAGLGVTEPVNSPTFSLVHEYAGRCPVWHLDVYRLSGPDDLPDLSWDDMLEGRGVLLIEWPERIIRALPEDRLEISLAYGDGDSRCLEITSHGKRAKTLIAGMEEPDARPGD